ncbi:hypothetical protein D6D19_05925 [Aureobasidium pullulans]|uniref:Uncharacterized protein n=1 Tax=Aureobasidium pullulans TaxID=5580 RepID=A0A4S9A2E3_AURPU|nr:hypothetical protein D6D19_05925 [Aureobasidium pullulans]
MRSRRLAGCLDSSLLSRPPASASAFSNNFLHFVSTTNISSSPEVHIILRKRPAAVDEKASASAPAPKRTRVGSPPQEEEEEPTYIARMLKAMQFQHEQLQQATDLWIRQKGGEDKLGDANTIYLRTVRFALHSGKQAMDMAEYQEGTAVEQENDLEERLVDIKSSLESRQDDKFQQMRYDFEGDMYDIANDAADGLLEPEQLREAMSVVFESRPETVFGEKWMEIKEFVLRQMKAAKDAPESSQDILREHEAEIGF